MPPVVHRGAGAIQEHRSRLRMRNVSSTVAPRRSCRDEGGGRWCLEVDSGLRQWVCAAHRMTRSLLSHSAGRHAAEEDGTQTPYTGTGGKRGTARARRMRLSSASG